MYYLKFYKPLPALLFFLLILTSAETYAAIEASEPLLKDPTVGNQPDIVPVSFVTLRNVTGGTKPSEYFGGNRGELHAGVADVSISPIWGVEDIAEFVSFYIPDERIELQTIRKTSLAAVFSEVETFSGEDNGNIVVYIHGYNIDFEKGCRRAAIFQRALGLHDRLIYLSWPADGNMLKYTWDEADLVWSVPHMADFFEDLVGRTGKGKLDIVAHSLGARGAFQALVRMAYRDIKSPLINELVLIAPDIDADIFRQEKELLQKVVQRITVYVSENDKPLKLSREVHGYPRLGEGGEYLTVIDGVDTIDISGINNRRLSGHLYHLFNKEVIDDLTTLLHTGKGPEERERLEAQVNGGGQYFRMISEE